MDDRWKTDFAAFLRDLGPRPPGATIERIDNNGHYVPGNVRWASSAEQALNRRTNLRLTLDGITLTMSEWATRTGIPRPLIWCRLKRLHWPVEKALSMPVRPLHRA